MKYSIQMPQVIIIKEGSKHSLSIEDQKAKFMYDHLVKLVDDIDKINQELIMYDINRMHINS